MPVEVLRCQYCGKPVSTPFTPEPTDTPDKGLILRAVVLCPECFGLNFVDKRKMPRGDI